MTSRSVFPCTTLYVLLVTLVLSLYLSLAPQRSEEEESIICPYNDKGCLKYLNEFCNGTYQQPL
ncbi:unnamed protein product [Arabidopsis halleri]